MKNTKQNELLSQSDAAKYVGVARGTFKKYRKHFTTYQSSTTLLYKLSELEHFKRNFVVMTPEIKIDPTQALTQNTVENADDLLSQREAAKYLGINKDALAKRRDAGDFNTYRLKKLVLYRKCELDKFKAFLAKN